MVDKAARLYESNMDKLNYERSIKNKKPFSKKKLLNKLTIIR